MPPGDVTAVVLTIDEPYTRRALASIERQRDTVADVVVVRGVAPFHRALNEGAARVRTPYFVQVDADMVLDPTCCAYLRACAAEEVGVVIGHLRDALLGRVAGIKLFRTRCFEDERFPDSISPDTDFGNAIARRGWMTIYALKYPEEPSDPLHVFGDHNPEYTPLYTFRKYALVGARYRYRRAAASLRELVSSLHKSCHETALFALIGTAYGVTLPLRSDRLEPYRHGADFERLEAFLGGPAADATPPAVVCSLMQLDAREAWRRGYCCGVDLHRQRAAGAFVAALNYLASQVAEEERGPIAWAALAGMSNGLLAEEHDEAESEQAFARLNEALPFPYRLKVTG